ncbi:hypothetical protein MTR67_032378 [Solanum verrucosum]|uniref:SNF2 N-terminal domain-containing protein n=1 Tax=Solanum verrucosum TaxID=315347 RepID=A0AAF0U436_SOLVR|nr:hypothetical protein MTR67_032378 [Solanum verrucosum]
MNPPIPGEIHLEMLTPINALNSSRNFLTKLIVVRVTEDQMDEDTDAYHRFYGMAPSDLILPLLRYQKEWLAWSLKQETIFKEGIHADEMGMGKTVKAIALVLAQRELKKATSGSSILPSSPGTS